MLLRPLSLWQALLAFLAGCFIYITFVVKSIEDRFDFVFMVMIFIVGSLQSLVVRLLVFFEVEHLITELAQAALDDYLMLGRLLR